MELDTNLNVQIRAKRLARLAALGGGSNSGSSSNNNSGSSVNLNANSSNSSIPKSKTTATPTPAPIDRSGPKEVEAESETPSKRKSTDSSAIETSKPKKVSESLSPEVEVSNWLKYEIEDIFVATIATRKTGLVYLPSLSSEVESDQKGLLTSANLESLFMEILTDLGIPSKFSSSIEYLFHIYTRSFQLKRILPKKDATYDLKNSVLNDIINFSCSYGLISFQVPDMFVNNDLRGSIDLFVNRQDSMSPFLVDIVKQAINQESLVDLLNILLPSLSAKLYQINLNDSAYSNYLSLFESLVLIKPVAAVFSKIDGFQPPNSKEGLDYENKTLLGPLLRLSPLIDSVGTYYFSNDVQSISRVQLNSIYQSIQNEYKVVIDRLFFIIDKLVRGSTETRQDLLKWLAGLVNVSHLRRGSHADFSKLASHGFMYNISIILIKLSLPFLEYPTYSKLDKIDFDYFTKNKLLNISEESRVNSSIKEADEYVKEHSNLSDPNFISECFYLTLTYLHYGIGGIFINYDRLKQQIKQYEERIQQIEQETNSREPMMAHMLRGQLPRFKSGLNSLRVLKNAIQAIFNFKSMNLEIFDFIIGSTTFITKLIDPSHEYPTKKLSIPIFKISKVSELDDHDFLKTKTPKPWKYYPEYVLEGIINYCKFMTKFPENPLIFNNEKLSSFVEFAIILLRCPELIGNPHMKANLIEVLFFGSLPLSNGDPGFMTSIFNDNKLVVDNILYSLLDFYVMVEKTGASSQFYDKFNSRYYISVILETLWTNDIYKNQLTDYSHNNVDFFVRFIARMLNDTTYLLDETFNELNSIHNYQGELTRRSNGIPGDTEEYGTDEELSGNLSSSERKAKSYMGLSNKTMELFKLFTKQVPSGFVLPEIVDRLSGMLNYNLSIMVGPKCSNLKVSNPEKYDFEPKKILGDLCEIYYNLSNEGKFLVSIARDGRSFNLKYFIKAHDILMKKTFINATIIDKFLKFGQEAEIQRQNDEDEEVELGEIPDEYLDPLMFTLMEDPVILPNSRMSIDRSTIKAHLLSDSTDPFNRVPLKLEDVIEDTDLKEKINQWKLSKKAPVEDIEMKD